MSQNFSTIRVIYVSIHEELHNILTSLRSSILVIKTSLELVLFSQLLRTCIPMAKTQIMTEAMMGYRKE